jgi:hypothetical protein
LELLYSSIFKAGFNCGIPFLVFIVLTTPYAQKLNKCVNNERKTEQNGFCTVHKKLKIKGKRAKRL